MNPTIIKCLELTASDNDAEALSAVRKANALLQKKGATWEQVFRTVKGRRTVAKGASNGVSVKEMLDTLSSIELPPGRAGFVNCASVYYSKRKRLPVKMHLAVAGIYETHYLDNCTKHLNGSKP